METENKKILSIIIPTYNAAKFLDKGLSSFIIDDNSLLNMLDIIVVNDGSTDNSVEVAQKYVNKYPDVYRILNKENGGHGSAINEGVKIIKGSYFKVVDADDWVNTDVLKETICYLKDNENKHENFADAVLMSYRSYVLQRENTDEYPYDDKYITKNGGPYNAGYVDEHLYDFWWGLSLHGVIYNTQFYRNTGVTLSEGVFYEDQEFSIIPMAYAESIYAYDKPRKPAYMMRFLCSNEHQTMSLYLPAKQAKLDAVLDCLEVDSWQEVRLEECDAAMPEMWRFTDMAYDGMEQINRFAQCLEELDRNNELIKFKSVAGQLDIRSLDDALALAEHLSEYALEPGIHSLEELAREELSVIVSDPDRDLLTRHLNMEAYGADLLWRDQGLFSDYGYICRPDGQPLQLPQQGMDMTMQ